MAIADVYDALISERPYKPPMPHEMAKEFIIKERGTQFDPILVDVFKRVAEIFRKIAQENADSSPLESLDRR